MDMLGRNVHIAWPSVDHSQPATCHVVFNIDGAEREITTGPLPTARAILHQVPVIERIEERYRLGDGTLHVGSKVEAAAGGQVLARTAAGAWEGGAYSVYAFLSGPDVDNAAIVRLFSKLRIRETAEGVRVTVKPGHGGAVVEEPTIALEQPQLGLLEITPMTWQRQRGLPRWRGTRARGGELFRDRLAGDVEYLRLANQTALTTVLPGNGRKFTGTELTNVVDGLQVEYDDG